jgi:hypothetical protein
MLGDACRRRKGGQSRIVTAEDHLESWSSLLRWPLSSPAEKHSVDFSMDQSIEQWATASVSVIGNYLLPVLYGYLGSLGFVLRRFNDKLAAGLLAPRDLRGSQIRLLLGALTGACIGLFINNPLGTAQATGITATAVTLSASAISFLAGYGVEGVFNAFDSAINHIFKLVDGDVNPTRK